MTSDDIIELALQCGIWIPLASGPEREQTIDKLRSQIRALVMDLHKMRPTRRPVTMQQAAAWRRFQKAMGGDGYFVEYASVGEIADAVVDLIVTEAGK